LDRVTAPTLLIVGELDHPVVEWNQDALERLKGEKEIILVSGATHLFAEPDALEKVAELAAAWFDGHLTNINS
jgi:dipeptidyl aminopeptidase/acylaminoacyl peptidase